MPETLTVNEAACPAMTVRLTGWLVIDGACTVGAGVGVGFALAPVPERDTVILLP